MNLVLRLRFRAVALHSPFLRCQWKFIEFDASFTPIRLVFIEDCDEAIAVRWLNQMCHFVDDHVFEKVLRLLYKFRVQPDVSRSVIAGSPLCFHSLQEILGDLNAQLGFPFRDQWRNRLVQK